MQQPQNKRQFVPLGDELEENDDELEFLLPDEEDGDDDDEYENYPPPGPKSKGNSFITGHVRDLHKRERQALTSFLNSKLSKRSFEISAKSSSAWLK